MLAVFTFLPNEYPSESEKHGSFYRDSLQDTMTLKKLSHAEYFLVFFFQVGFPSSRGLTDPFLNSSLAE